MHVCGLVAIGKCERTCVVWPKTRISRILGCPRIFNFERVVGGRRCSAGLPAFEGVVMGIVGERKDSRHATRRVEFAVRLLISRLDVGSRRWVSVLTDCEYCQQETRRWREIQKDRLQAW